MRNTIRILVALTLTLASCATVDRSSIRPQPSWQLGRTRVAITQVYTKDPASELESKTSYLDNRLLGLLDQSDGEELECPMYCVIRFTHAATFRVKVSCRADGNHQIIAFSPLSRSFTLKDFRNIRETETLVLDVDSADSRYLVLNCTAGRLFVDAITIEETDGQQSPAGNVLKAAPEE